VSPPLSRFEWERLIRELDLPLTVKCAAYALATYVNGDGRNAHPGVQNLMKATGMSRASILRALSALELEGFIVVRSQGGSKGVPRGHASVYELSTPGTALGRHGKTELP
jgi:hypothetical protein